MNLREASFKLLDYYKLRLDQFSSYINKQAEWNASPAESSYDSIICFHQERLAGDQN